MFNEIAEFVGKHYKIEAKEVTKLEGYGSENYKIKSDSETFILKLYEPSDEPNLWELLEAENQIQLKLNAESKGVFPVPQKDSNGKYLSYSESKNKYYRLLTYVDGELFSDVEHTSELFYEFGKYVAEMNSHLLDFRHIATEARKFPWDLQYWKTQ